MIAGVTIDNASTRDMDDGLFAEYVGDDVRLCIAITNVAKRVEVGGEEDDAARTKCFTRYRGSGHGGMLPPKFTDELCSLVVNEVRPVVVVELLISPTGKARETVVRLDEFVNRAQLAYNEIPAVLGGKHPLAPNVSNMVIAVQAGTNRLFATRKARGSVAYADPVTGMFSSEDGILENVSEDEFVGCMMVQEAMIAANEALARYAAENDVPVIYRNHVARVATPPRADLVAQLEQAKNLPLPHLSAFIERVDVLLDRAQYGAHVRGHFALCAPFYTHATSPIRRYADLVTQRQIVAHLSEERLPHSQHELQAFASYINSTIDSVANAQREYMRARTLAVTESRLARVGYKGLSMVEFERVVHQLRCSDMPPSVEFVDDVVRRIESGDISHRAIGGLLPMLPSSALWEHVSSAICAKFVATPEHATLVMKASKDLGLWTATVVDVVATKPPQVPIVSCVGTLLDGEDVSHGQRCFASAQRAAWHRAIAAVVIQRLDGEVPGDWVVGASLPSSSPSTVSQKFAVSELWSIVHRLAKPVPVYSFQSEGPPHKPQFKCTCAVGNSKSSGVGRDKQTAKNMAASAMITKLGGGGSEVRA